MYQSGFQLGVEYFFLATFFCLKNSPLSKRQIRKRTKANQCLPACTFHVLRLFYLFYFEVPGSCSSIYVLWPGNFTLFENHSNAKGKINVADKVDNKKDDCNKMLTKI